MGVLGARLGCPVQEQKETEEEETLERKDSPGAAHKVHAGGEAHSA
jgi:hypothetical protein